MRVSAFHGDAEQNRCLHVARAVKPAKISVATGAHGSIRALRAAHAKLEQSLGVAHGQSVSRGVGRNQTRVVDQHQHGGLEQLADAEGTLDSNERHARDDEAALVECKNFDGRAVECR